MISLSVARWTQVAKSVSELMMKKHALHAPKIVWSVRRLVSKKHAGNAQLTPGCIANMTKSHVC
jgi:hypothetical protein